MTSLRLGKNIAIITAAALVLAACSKEPEVETDNTETAAVVETPTAQPDPVETPTIEQQELDKWKGRSQNGVEAYAGADRVFFEYDSSDLTDRGRRVLGKQSEWLMHYTSVRATIEGHCDERGTREYNLALGARRATAVKNYLVALGVPASRLNTISYGKERPAEAGNYSQNRRGVLVVQ
ncbi:MAG: peptidoglycan-associated lipoprotein [Kordiimonadales bacterium]|nr:MAG: peptidoglycan-associated lipoprotein [Kordiimonadales bacterium]